MEQNVDHQADGENNSASEVTACTKEPSLEEISNKTEQTGCDEKHEGEGPVSRQEVGAEEAHISNDLDCGEHTDWNISVGNEENEHMHSKQKVYEDDEFDGSEDDVTSKSKEADPVHSPWNLDPNSRENDQGDQPSPKANSQDEIGSGQTIWNADPHAAASDTSVGDQVGVDNDDEPAAVVQQENSVSSEDDDTNNAWNLDPSPSIPTNENPVDTPYTAEVQSGLDDDSKGIDDTEGRNAWNLDPTPSSAPAATSPAAEPTDTQDDEEEQPVWNLDPDPVADVVVSPDLPPEDSDNTEETHPEFVEDDVAEGNTSADASHVVAQDSPDITSVAEPTTTNETESSAWNLGPSPPSSSPSPADDNAHAHDGSTEPVHSEDSRVPEVANTDGDGGLDDSVQIESDGQTVGTEVDQNNAWNLDPSGTATGPVGMPESIAANEGEGEGERTVWNLDPHAGTATDPVDMPAANEGEDENDRTVWNLDPHTGDASEPIDSVTEVTDAQQSAQTPINAELAVDQEQLEASSGNGTPTFADEEGASEPGSSQNSARESAASSPAEDDTPDYTPPSTGRDSDAAADEGEDDATW